MKNKILKEAKAVKGQRPTSNRFKDINFKNIKSKNIEEFDYKIEWEKYYDFVNPLTIDEADLEYDYDWGFIEYKFYHTYLKNPVIYLINDNAYDKSFITDFLNFLNPPINSYKIKTEYDEKGFYIENFTITIEKEFIMQFDGRSLTFFVSDEKMNGRLFKEFLSILSSYVNIKHQENKIYVVYKADYGFDKKGFDVKKIDVNIEKNYNDDFKETSDYIIKNLNDKTKTGLYVLEGEPGTGKCVIGKTKITVKNKKTGKVEDICIEDLM